MGPPAGGRLHVRRADRAGRGTGKTPRQGWKITMADALTCTIVTPEQTALETKADFVALPLFDGEIGIAANHGPLIGRRGYGEIRITSAGQTAVYYIDGGFVQ